jgi:hypothetical protein
MSKTISIKELADLAEAGGLRVDVRDSKVLSKSGLPEKKLYLNYVSTSHHGKEILVEVGRPMASSDMHPVLFSTPSPFAAPKPGDPEPTSLSAFTALMDPEEIDGFARLHKWLGKEMLEKDLLRINNKTYRAPRDAEEACMFNLSQFFKKPAAPLKDGKVEHSCISQRLEKNQALNTRTTFSRMVPFMDGDTEVLVREALDPAELVKGARVCSLLQLGLMTVSPSGVWGLPLFVKEFMVLGAAQANESCPKTFGGVPIVDRAELERRQRAAGGGGGGAPAAQGDGGVTDDYNSYYGAADEGGWTEASVLASASACGSASGSAAGGPAAAVPATGPPAAILIDDDVLADVAGFRALAPDEDAGAPAAVQARKRVRVTA